MQHGAGGGFDGLLFAGADGAGGHTALWWSDSAATGESFVAAGRGGRAELAARAAGAARAARNFTNRSGFGGAGHAFDAGFVWSTAIGNQMVTALPDSVDNTPTLQTWKASTYLTNSGVPQSVASQLRIYERSFFLSTK